MIEWEKIKRIPIREREHKVRVKDFALPYTKGDNFSSFVSSLPHILKGKELRELVGRMVEIKKDNHPIVFLMGAHPVKCGLNPLFIEMGKKGWITSLSTHIATTIHDMEIALIGETSEDVRKGLEKGLFGMVKETPELFSLALKLGLEENIGLGEALGKFISLHPDLFPYRDYSLLYNFYRLSIPLTIHAAIGTDTIFQHPEIKGGDVGELSHRDFLKLVKILENLGGGAVINVGSAVILPEVFLKAFSLVRNIKGELKEFITVNFDMILHYRVEKNILQRPGGKYFNFLGHHEIMIPLFFALLEEAG